MKLRDPFRGIYASFFNSMKKKTERCQHGTGWS